jgi:alpha-tubulin suppressor-like RCC1 family protein
VPGLSGIKFVAVGATHTCALLSNATVKCWGQNTFGQLGDGTTTNRLTPTLVPGLSSVKAIDAEGANTCAFLTNNTMKCWGRNQFGQIGDGTTVNRSSPITVVGIGGVIMSTGSSTHRCAVLTGSIIKCWGQNTFGQLGDGTTMTRLLPTSVPALAGTGKWVSAHGTSTCALVTGNTVKCWGQNNYGQLGDGTLLTRLNPVSVTGLTGVTVVSGGTHHQCVRLLNATAKCWGRNHFGQLGDNTTTNRTTPVAVLGLGGLSVSQIQGGAAHTALRTAAGSLRSWGLNANGQLGSGTTTNRSTPGPVTGYGFTP